MPSNNRPQLRTDGSFDFGPNIFVAAMSVNAVGDPQLVNPINRTVMPTINVVSNVAPSNSDGRPDGTIYLQTA